MVKTRLYENEDDISKLIDTNVYDAIFLENRPVDLIGNRDYLAILTKRKESSQREKAGEWILKIFMRGTNGKWQLTPGQWYLKTLLGYGDVNPGGFLDEDNISIDGTPNWKVFGMIEIMQEAIEKTQYEFDQEDDEELSDYKEPKEENKNKDYSKMKKWELEKIVNQALDNKDYAMLDKIYKYLPEAVIGKVKFMHKHTLNEKLINTGEEDTSRSIDLRGPTGNAFVILGMAKKFTKDLKEVDPETYDWETIHAEMTAGNYKNLVLTFEKYFGDYVTIYNADILEESLNESFASWYASNKNSDILWDEYADYCADVPKNQRSSFKEWCKERYEWAKEYEGNVDESLNEDFDKDIYAGVKNFLINDLGVKPYHISNYFLKDNQLLNMWKNKVPEEKIVYWIKSVIIPKYNELSYLEYLDEGIKHLKPRSKEELLRNAKSLPKESKEDDELDESLNEKEEKQILMGHNSPNPDDPEVNGLAYRIESEEELKDKIEESVDDYTMPRLTEKYFVGEEEPPVDDDKEKEAKEKEEEEKEMKRYKTTDESVNDPYIMPRLLEDKITKSYNQPMTREEVRKLIAKILFKFQTEAKYQNITSMLAWTAKNNFGDLQSNRWLRAIIDTLFKKIAGSWTQINTNLSIDQLTDKAMNYWKDKMTKESIDEGCGCGPKKKPTGKFTPAPKRPSIFRPKSK